MGCGNGQITSQLFDSSELVSQIPKDARLVAADVSQEFVDMVKKRKEERSHSNPLWQRLEVYCWDACNLNHIKDGEVSHLLGSFAYFAMKDQTTALAEAYRMLKPGGIFVEASMGSTEWGDLPHFVKQVRPEKTIPGPQEHWQSVEGVTKTLSDVGFKDVKVREFEVTLPVDKYEDAMEFCFEGFPYMRALVADLTMIERLKRDCEAQSNRSDRKFETKIFDEGFHGWLELPRSVVGDEDRVKAYDTAVEFILGAHKKALTGSI